MKFHRCFQCWHFRSLLVYFYKITVSLFGKKPELYYDNIPEIYENCKQHIFFKIYSKYTTFIHFIVWFLSYISQYTIYFSVVCIFDYPVPSRTLLSVKDSTNLFGDLLHSWQLQLYRKLMTTYHHSNKDGNHSNNEHHNIAE